MRYVLAGYDGSAGSSQAVSFARTLAEQYGARLHILTVARLPLAGMDTGYDDLVEQQIRHGEHLLDALGRELTGCSHGVHLSIRMGKPACQLAEYAVEYGVDHVVVGDTRSILPGWWSTGERIRHLLRGTPCQVTVVERARCAKMRWFEMKLQGGSVHGRKTIER
jgi:nucleotide-binding universal stress UspA family protein